MTPTPPMSVSAISADQWDAREAAQKAKRHEPRPVGMPEKRVGKVEHYYPKVEAAAVGLSAPLKIGDKVHIVGHGDDFEEKVTSLQLDHEPIQEGKPGQSVGLHVNKRVHEGDEVYVVQGREKTATHVPDAPGPTGNAASAAAPSRRGGVKAGRTTTRKVPRRPARARSAAAARKPKRARKATTRKRTSPRAGTGSRSAARRPKRKTTRTATKGKRAKKGTGPKRRPGSRKGASRKRTR